MTRNVLLSLLIALSLVGLADSVYLTESVFTDTPLVCDIQGLNDCNTVAGSPYSKLFEIPLSVYGLGFYGALLLLSLLLLYRPSKQAAKGLVFVSILGVLASVYFLYVQVFIIQALCIYCVGSAVIAFILCALALLYFKRLLPPQPPVLP